ncbi:MAG: acetyl-CoA carboxylase biotin carboxyl carrier protein [Sneathiella sp.]
MNKLNIDKKAIRELAEIMNETGLGEIEIETGDHRLRVSRGSSASATAQELVQAVVPAAGYTSVAPAPAVVPDNSNHPGAVKSPMVGTVYLSPEPGAAPFVRVGDTVNEGQTLVIVEAMKTMNPIASTKAGKVAEILVTDKEPVEYGQPLVIIE